jgi:integrase
MERPRKNANGLRFKAGRWYGRWFDANGCRHERSLSKDRRVAEQMLRALTTQGELGSVSAGPPARDDVEVKGLVAEYLEHQRGRASESHHRSITEGLNDIVDRLGIRTVAEITLQRLEGVQDAMLAGTPPGVEPAEKPKSHRTINKKSGHLLTFLRWAARTGRIARNPLVGLKKLPERPGDLKKRRHRLTADEARALIAAARAMDAEDAAGDAVGVPQAPLIETLLGTGFRIGEAAALTWADMRHDGGVWWLTVTAENAKNSTARTNPIPPELAASLQALRGVQGRVLGHLPRQGDSILLQRDGKPQDARGLRAASRWFDRVLNRAGLDKDQSDGTSIDFHALRHTFCCLLREQSVDLGTAAALMGHKTLAMTQRIYSDLDRLPKVSAIKALPSLTSYPKRDGAADGSTPAGTG